MKKQEHLFEAIGQVDDRLVEEAADARRTATPWKKWAAMAACLVLVIGLGASSLALLFRGCGSASMTSDSAATESASDTADGSDSATTAEDSAGAPETNGTSGESAATGNSAESAADSADPEDSAATNDSADRGDTVPDLPVIGTLSADADGLTASRTVTITDEFGALTVRDTYHVSAAESVDTMLYYPAGTTTYTVEVDGEPLTPEPDGQGNYSFPLTLEAGTEAEVAVVVTLAADVEGIAGFTLCTEGGTVTVTEQTVQWSLTNPDLTILENDFGARKGTAVLQPPETYRLILQKE